MALEADWKDEIIPGRLSKIIVTTPCWDIVLITMEDKANDNNCYHPLWNIIGQSIIT